MVLYAQHLNRGPIQIQQFIYTLIAIIIFHGTLKLSDIFEKYFRICFLDIFRGVCPSLLHRLSALFGLCLIDNGSALHTKLDESFQHVLIMRDKIPLTHQVVLIPIRFLIFAVKIDFPAKTEQIRKFLFPFQRKQILEREFPDQSPQIFILEHLVLAFPSFPGLLDLKFQKIDRRNDDEPQNSLVSFARYFLDGINAQISRRGEFFELVTVPFMVGPLTLQKVLVVFSTNNSLNKILEFPDKVCDEDKCGPRFLHDFLENVAAVVEFTANGELGQTENFWGD